MHVILDINPSFKKHYYDLETIQDLRYHLEHDNPNSDIWIRYACKTIDDNSMILLEGGRYHVTITLKLEPKKLVAYLLNSSNSDISKISRKYLKFASCPTGQHIFRPFRVAMKNYTESQKVEFYELFEKHFGFQIAIIDDTFYDKEAVNFLLSLFHDAEYLLDCQTVEEIYLKHPKNFMNFINIIFGEIIEIPNGPSPLFTQGVDYDHQIINFNDLEPKLQEIVIVMRDIYAKN